MISGASNNVNSVSYSYRYDHNTMRGASSSFNTAGVKQNAKTSHINSDGIKAINDIKTNAQSMLEELGTLGNTSAFSKMNAVSSNAESERIDSNRESSVNANGGRENINQLTTSQEATGREIEADRSNTASRGDRQTEIESNGRTRQSATGDRAADARTSGVAERNTSGAADAAKGLVNSFNNLVSAAKSGLSSRLSQDLTAVVGAHSSSLEKIGITSNKDGTLAVDSDRLEKAEADGSLNSFFTQPDGRNSGFTDRLGQIANQAITSVSGNPGTPQVANEIASVREATTQNFVSRHVQQASSHQSMNNYMFGSGSVGQLIDMYA